VRGTSEELADIMDGYYLTTVRENQSKESFDNADMEQVVCGVGGWRLCTEYESDELGATKLVPKRKPIYEFNSTVLWDGNARAIDKSDARRCCVLTPFTEKAYCDFVEEMTGERPTSEGSFKWPEFGFSFPWVFREGGNDVIYVGEFYYRYKETRKVYFYRDFAGNIEAVDSRKRSQIEELESAGYEFDGEKVIQKWRVDKYYVSAEGVIGKPERIAGEHIPIVPQYGDRAFIQGVEHYEGVVKSAKDPQMLRDFSMSYLADIVGRSPRIKNIYAAEQIQGFEYMYNETGADNAYPYLLQRLHDANGNPLPVGPLGQTPEQPVPTALTQLIGEMRVAVEDVATAGLPNNVADPDLSGKALNTLVAMFDQQSVVYQENKKYALRRDAEIFASIMADIVQDEAELVVTQPSGNRDTAVVNRKELNIETGDIEIKNDLSRARFEVYADVTKSYSSSREEAESKLLDMLPTAVTTDPALAKAMQLKIMALQDGADMKDMRKWANNQLVLLGFREPETDEEVAMLQQAQEAQSQQQDPNMALAMAEQMKAQNGAVKNQIDQFRAETDRMAVLVDAEKANAEIDYKAVQSESLKFNDVMKLRGSANGVQ
jgi:hypothetical protein